MAAILAGAASKRAIEAGALTILAARLAAVDAVRPLAPLRGNSFSGFFRKSLRQEYVALGEERAREVV